MTPHGVHHIGHAVADLDAAVDTYRRTLGGRVEHRQIVPDQGVEAVTLMVGDARIELLSPLHPDTPVGRFLEKRGPGMHHVAYLVDDVAGALAAAVAAGAEAIDQHPRAGLFGMMVGFVHPDSMHGVLVEFVSPSREEHAHG
ncbi:MAG TPA: methylmalonyl-CoA epimerase [Gaiellales bacterium]|nr:methylmalonyl-CoA epimerase [Gaiellales bacterium]